MALKRCCLYSAIRVDAKLGLRSIRAATKRLSLADFLQTVDHPAWIRYLELAYLGANLYSSSLA